MSATIGPYTIERHLAEGGMGQVFLARHRTSEGLERRVVLKRVMASDDLEDDSVAMLMDESRLMAGLAHPNIAQVYDLGRDGDSFYLAMEYVRGPTLFKLLTAARQRGDGPVPEPLALEIALGVGEALAYVHDRLDHKGRPLGIVHRDLSPANVLVTYDGTPKLIDFGIAKAASRLALTTVGHVKGTHGYIAPELLLGMQADARADVFALGVLLYEMLFLAHPFEGKTIAERLARMRAADYQRPRTRKSGFPPVLEKILEGCLAPHPEGRPSTMSEVVEGLAGHMSDRGYAPTMGHLSDWVIGLVPDPEPRSPPRPRAPHASNALDDNAAPSDETIVARTTKRPPSKPFELPQPEPERPAAGPTPALPLPAVVVAPRPGVAPWMIAVVALTSLAVGAGALLAMQYLTSH